MATHVITLCYRKIIDHTNTGAWDQLVYEDTYREFRMQAQSFTHQSNYTRYSDLLLHVKGADNLPFLTSAAAIPYLRQLNDQVPDIADNLGRLFLLFRNFRFEIIQSDIRDKGRHRVAISFITEPMTWHHTIGTYLLLSHLSAEPADGAMPTYLLQLQPFLSIDSIKNA